MRKFSVTFIDFIHKPQEVITFVRYRNRTAVKFILGLLLIYFIYRFFIKRQRNLDPHQKHEAKMGEYIDYEEVKDEEYKNR